MTRTIRQKTVLRDSGLLHALLGIETTNDLYGHPVVGASWEGLVIEQLIGCIGDPSVDSSFYRTMAGADIDLIFSSSTGKQAFEIKLGLTPSLSKGYHLAGGFGHCRGHGRLFRRRELPNGKGRTGQQFDRGDAGISDGSHEECSLVRS